MDGRRRPRTSPTRDKLYTAAVSLIAEKGYSSTSVEEIAERAGVAKGTVYYNFPSKTALFEGLLEHGVGILTTAFTGAAASCEDPLDALDAVVRAELAYIEAYPAFAQLLLSEMWRTNRSWKDTLALLREQVVAVLADVLRAAVARGQLREGLDVGVTASAIFGMTLVVALDWLAFQPDRSLDDVHGTVVELLRGRVGPVAPA